MYTEEQLAKLHKLSQEGLSLHEEQRVLKDRLALIPDLIAANQREIRQLLGLEPKGHKIPPTSEGYRGPSQGISYLLAYTQDGVQEFVHDTTAEAFAALTHNEQWPLIPFKLREGRTYRETTLGTPTAQLNLARQVDRVMRNLERYWRGEEGAHRDIVTLSSRIPVDRRDAVRSLVDVLRNLIPSESDED